MHRFKYRQIEYKAGITIEVAKCMPKGSRGGDRKTSPEEIAEANMRQAARKLARKINANFKPGDWHVVLMYKKDSRPDLKQAQKNMKKLIDSLRDRYKKSGLILKYIHVTEYYKKAIHHHLIINNVNDGKKTTTEYIRELWKGDGKGSKHFTPLYEDGEYKKLAEYFIKETEKTFRSSESPVRQRYSCSRNLINPKPTIRTREVKGMWKLDPKPRAGYYIDPDSLYNGTDRLGRPYQRYVMIKLNPTDSDWEPCERFAPE